MFFRSILDKKGFFDTLNTTASTIDWCEPNYADTHYLAESQNAISSLAIAFGGLFGLFWSIKFGHTRSLKLLSILLAIVGFGSFLFHGTLLFIPQLLDELPMGWAMIQFYCIFVEISKSVLVSKQNWYKQAERRQRTDKHLTPILARISYDSLFNDPYSYFLHFYALRPFYYIAHMIKGTFLENCMSFDWAAFCAMAFLSILHGVYGFVLTFQAFFFLISIGAAGCISQLPSLFSNPTIESSSEEDVAVFSKILSRYQVWLVWCFGSAIVAFLCWILDNNFCSALLKNRPYISFHALWHLLNYWSTYSGIVLAAYGLEMASTASRVDVENLNTIVQLQDTITTTQTDNKPMITLTQITLTPGQVKEVEFSSYPILGTMLTGVDHLAELNEIV